jgi:hypothetical protein
MITSDSVKQANGQVPLPQFSTICTVGLQQSLLPNKAPTARDFTEHNPGPRLLRGNGQLRHKAEVIHQFGDANEDKPRVFVE